jgi:O-antigen ligase
MKLHSWLKESSVYFVVFVVAAALPTYLLRFHIGALPMTVSEVVELAGIAVLIAKMTITHPTLPYIKGGDGITSPLKVRGAGGSYVSLFKNNALLTIGSVLIILSTIISIIIAPDKLSALGIAKAYFWEPMALAWLIILTKPDATKIKRAAVYGFAASAAVVIIYGLIQYAWPARIPATWTAERRITSIFDFPNATALYLAPLIPLFLSIPFGIIISLAAIVIIILAKSAGGLIAVAAAFFFMGVTSKRMRVATIIAAVTVMAVVALAPQAAGLREQILLRDWSGRVHMIGWKESLAMLRDHPIFGAGLNGFKTAVAPYHTAQGVEIFQYPHNLFLAAWSELGLTGLIGFGLVLIWFFKKTLRRNCPLSIVHCPFLAAAMIAIIVHGLVDVPYFKNDLSAMFWLLVAIVAL